MVDAERIFNKLDTLAQQISEGVTATKSLATESRAYWERVRKHDAELYGENGNPGIIKDVERLKIMSGIRSQIIWMIAGAGATIVTGVIVFFVQKAFGG